jgi:hypothetical protein
MKLLDSRLHGSDRLGIIRGSLKIGLFGFWIIGIYQGFGI